MNRSMKLSLAVASIVLGSAGSSHATTLTFDPAADVLFAPKGNICTQDSISAPCDTLSFEYVLAGYNSSSSTLGSTLLTLWFYDDTDPGKGNGNPESFTISFDGGATSAETTITNKSTEPTKDPFEFDVAANITNGGHLAVLLGRGALGGGQNDFFFAGSVLSASWTAIPVPPPPPPVDPPPTFDPPVVPGPDSTPVPEPTSLMLLGTGLAASGYWARRKSRQTR